MRATVFHEPDGTIAGLFALPHGPIPPAVVPARGVWRCEVELPQELAGQSLLAVLDGYRVELSGGRARLAPAL